jgi:hypothetical protein
VQLQHVSKDNKQEEWNGSVSKDSKDDFKYNDGNHVGIDQCVNMELIEAMTRQIAELKMELKHEHMKVKLYQSLFKQSQDELETLRAHYATKTEKSPTNDLEWESYCAVNRMDGTESDDVSSPIFKTSQASDESGRDDMAFQGYFKWPCNNSTDEGVGSELQSMDQSLRMHGSPLGTMSESLVSARNNYNIRSLRQALKELSSCYNDLLERNMVLEVRLHEALQLSKKKSKENRLMKELEKSYGMLRVVVDTCVALLHNTGITCDSNSLRAISLQPTDIKPILRDACALRRNVEELNRVALERLVIARYRSSSVS